MILCNLIFGSMAAYYNRICNRFEAIPTNRYAFYIDYKFHSILYYYENDDGDRHEFLKFERIDLSRFFNISWERIQIKLVEDVSGLAPISLLADSLTV